MSITPSHVRQVIFLIQLNFPRSISKMLKKKNEMKWEENVHKKCNTPSITTYLCDAVTLLFLCSPKQT